MEIFLILKNSMETKFLAFILIGYNL